MILTPHILVGAAIASQTDSMPAIIGISFLSHFLFDIVPHYEYKVDSVLKSHGKSKNDSAIAFFKIGLDILTGVSIFTLSASGKIPETKLLVGAGAALLPDFLLFVFFRYPNMPVIRQLGLWHQKTHWFEKIAKPNFLGLATQIAVSALAFMFLFL